MGYKHGNDRHQMTLLPITPDDYVDAENPVRIIDAFVDSQDLKELGFTKAEPAETGRPAYSPQDMLKLYIYGYFNRVRSSRRLETETKRNLEVIWLMNGLSPDHKTIARFRKDNAVALKNTFRAFVRLCDKLKLYGKELLSVDGSKFSASNSKERNFTKNKLKDRIRRIDEKLYEYFAEMDDLDETENEAVKPAAKISEITTVLTERKEKYEALLQEITDKGETQVSLTDSDSRLMNTANHNSKVAYNIQTAVDSKNGMIAGFKATNISVDKGQLFSTVQEAEWNLDVDEIEAIADKGYDSPTDIMNCIKNGIKANVSMDAEFFDMCIEDEKIAESVYPEGYENGRCVYLKERNIVICPMGQILYPSSYSESKHAGIYRNREVCKRCAHKCTKQTEKCHEVSMYRKYFSKEYKDKNVKIRPYRYKPDKKLLKLRKSLSEHPFGVVKRCLGADYFLCRGFEMITAETALAFMVFNLKRAISILGVSKMIKAIAALG